VPKHELCLGFYPRLPCQNNKNEVRRNKKQADYLGIVGRMVYVYGAKQMDEDNNDITPIGVIQLLATIVEEHQY
jgi:hypothetical protein